jgi:hypothetical protein
MPPRHRRRLADFCESSPLSKAAPLRVLPPHRPTAPPPHRPTAPPPHRPTAPPPHRLFNGNAVPSYSPGLIRPRRIYPGYVPHKSSTPKAVASGKTDGDAFPTLRAHRGNPLRGWNPSNPFPGVAAPMSRQPRALRGNRLAVDAATANGPSPMDHRRQNAACPSSCRLQGDTPLGGTPHLKSQICDLRSPISHLPSTIYHLPSTICHLPSTIYHLPSTIYHLPSTIYHLPSPITPRVAPLEACRRRRDG